MTKITIIFSKWIKICDIAHEADVLCLSKQAFYLWRRGITFPSRAHRARIRACYPAVYWDFDM
jgi:hypothetical protein